MIPVIPETARDSTDCPLPPESSSLSFSRCWTFGRNHRTDGGKELFLPLIPLPDKTAGLPLQQIPFCLRDFLGSHNDNRQILKLRRLFHSTQYFETVHLRHEQIQEDHVDFVLFEELKCTFAVIDCDRRATDGIQDFTYQTQCFLVIIDNQTGERGFSI